MPWLTMTKRKNSKVFHGFGQAQFPDGGWVLGSSQFSILPRLPPNMILSLKVVKIDAQKISNSVR